jgi:hypothetical protein
MRGRSALCALIVTFGFATPAIAGPEEAARLLKEAGAALEAKDWVTCEAKAELAWQQFQQVAIAGALGICELEQGKYAEAANHLDFFVRLSRADARRDEAQAKLEQAKKFVAEVRLQCNEQEAIASVDGKELGKAPLTVFVDPGERRFEAKSPSGETGAKVEVVVAGTSVAVNVEIKTKTVRQADPIWPAILLGGIAAAGVGTGIGLIVVGETGLSDAETAICPGDEATCSQDVRDAVDQRNAMVVGGSVAIGIGVAALGGMIIDLVVRDPGGEDIGCIPIVSPTTIGGNFLLHF